MSLELGIIADDFTGATDIANTLAKERINTVQIIGVPDTNTTIDNAKAVVVALKSRSIPPNEAVQQSLDTLNWFKLHEVKQIIFKYCSTFDSTKHGNIGPVADVLIDALNSQIAIICPAFPENNRTIYMGHLFVGTELLSESPLKDHPLNPMRDSNLIRLMESQSKYKAGLIQLNEVRNGPQSIKRSINKLSKEGFRYAVADSITNDDLIALGSAVSNHPLVTGSSGIGFGISRDLQPKISKTNVKSVKVSNISGKSIILAGSCSKTTRSQLARVIDLWPSIKLDVAKIVKNKKTKFELIEWARNQPTDQPVVIFSSSSKKEILELQRDFEIRNVGKLIEKIFADIAESLVKSGFRKLIVAGGETSGAVVSALNIKKLRIGQEISPGIPWTETYSDPKLALALKSGNFGDQDFFIKAIKMIQDD